MEQTTVFLQWTYETTTQTLRSWSYQCRWKGKGLGRPSILSPLKGRMFLRQRKVITKVYGRKQ
jgi:hypothetical protein